MVPRTSRAICMALTTTTLSIHVGILVLTRPRGKVGRGWGNTKRRQAVRGAARCAHSRPSYPKRRPSQPSQNIVHAGIDGHLRSSQYHASSNPGCRWWCAAPPILLVCPGNHSGDPPFTVLSLHRDLNWPNLGDLDLVNSRLPKQLAEGVDRQAKDDNNRYRLQPLHILYPAG